MLAHPHSLLLCAVAHTNSDGGGVLFIAANERQPISTTLFVICGAACLHPHYALCLLVSCLHPHYALCLSLCGLYSPRTTLFVFWCHVITRTTLFVFRGVTSSPPRCAWCHVITPTVCMVPRHHPHSVHGAMSTPPRCTWCHVITPTVCYALLCQANSPCKTCRSGSWRAAPSFTSFPLELHACVERQRLLCRCPFSIEFKCLHTPVYRNSTTALSLFLRTRSQVLSTLLLAFICLFLSTFLLTASLLPA
jgi:hypothetical protein